MHINIVTVSSGWILQKISERTANGNKDPEVRMTISHTPDTSADANYYADLQNCYFGHRTKCDVAYFTHADENSQQWLINLLAARKGFTLNGIVSMNKRYTDMLVEVGFPAHKLATITPGQTHDMFPLKKTTIGIVSRGGYPGYGQQFMEELLESYDFKHYNIRILGGGWGNLSSIAKRRNISLEIISNEDYSAYPAFYQSLDYLLIPGLWTAGPISMQEALSTGIPIIGADVGFVGYEFSADYIFKPGDVHHLCDILNRILVPKLNRRRQVEHMTWEQYSKDVVDFIKKVKNNTIL